MKLWDYLKMYKGWVEFDAPDSEIDTIVYVCMDNSEPYKISKDFPYMDKFIQLLYKKVDIDCFVPDGIPVCDFSKIIHDNETLFKKHIKKHWVDGMQWVLNQDAIETGEFAYEIIKEFDNVIGGRYGESVNKQYYELLKACE